MAYGSRCWNPSALNDRSLHVNEQPEGRPDIPRVGAVAPDFVLPNTSREMRRLDDLVANRPVIVVFYRGYW